MQQTLGEQNNALDHSTLREMQRRHTASGRIIIVTQKRLYKMIRFGVRSHDLNEVGPRRLKLLFPIPPPFAVDAPNYGKDFVSLQFNAHIDKTQ